MKHIKLALPKGQLQMNTRLLLEKANISVREYQDNSRSYKPLCETYPQLFLKVFQEKDIAVQVAIGNYDLGICHLDWIDELMVKFPKDAIVKIRDLGFGKRTLFAVTMEPLAGNSLTSLRNNINSIRIVSEYPNLSQSFALRQRFRKFRIFPVWGSADNYLPENAEIAVITQASMDDLRVRGMIAVESILESSAYLIANKDSLGKKDMGEIIAALLRSEVDEPIKMESNRNFVSEVKNISDDVPVISLALPDGHQQEHMVSLFNRSGLEVKGYTLGVLSVRPSINIDGIRLKVIRPQDMPVQVANGNFDLAVTGKDWLFDHRFRFPLSPVKELLDLKFGKVKIVAVVSNNVPVNTISDLRTLKWDTKLRIASEYMNIADKYARDNHLTPCKIIPTWGASEAFLPEDADVLIENTETGSTIARNNLKIIDTLFISTGCLIANATSIENAEKKVVINNVINAMRTGVEAGA